MLPAFINFDPASQNTSALSKLISCFSVCEQQILQRIKTLKQIIIILEKQKSATTTAIMRNYLNEKEFLGIYYEKITLLLTKLLDYQSSFCYINDESDRIYTKSVTVLYDIKNAIQLARFCAIAPVSDNIFACPTNAETIFYDYLTVDDSIFTKEKIYQFYDALLQWQDNLYTYHALNEAHRQLIRYRQRIDKDLYEFFTSLNEELSNVTISGFLGKVINGLRNGSSNGLANEGENNKALGLNSIGGFYTTMSLFKNTSLQEINNNNLEFLYRQEKYLDDVIFYSKQNNEYATNSFLISDLKDRKNSINNIKQALEKYPEASLFSVSKKDNGSTLLAQIAFGDVLTAQNITYIVPGMNSNTEKSSGHALAARNLFDQIKNFSDKESHAVIMWLNYDSPNIASVHSTDKASNGAKNLVMDIESLRKTREDSPVEQAKIHIVAHSYGTTLSSIALSKKNNLQVDSFIMLASAGLPKNIISTENLSVKEGRIYATEAPSDSTADLGRNILGFKSSHPNNPLTDVWGVQVFGSDGAKYNQKEFHATDGHSLIDDKTSGKTVKKGYLSTKTESLYTVAKIITS